MCSISVSVEKGVELFEAKRYDEAIPYLEKGVGIKSSCLFMLGEIYRHLGSEVDLTKALGYHQSATDRGDVGSQTRLGIMYRDGCGVEVDTGKARTLFLKSANMGDNLAKEKLSEIYHEGVKSLHLKLLSMLKV